MTLRAFEESLGGSAPPSGLSHALQALWHERCGNWNRAHEIAQDHDDGACAWVHTYLHRREGDLSNAAYWYRRAARPTARGDMDQEWRDMVSALLITDY
jgi:hypothetical protein